MLTTVVIPTIPERKKFLKEALDSVKNQTIPCKIIIATEGYRLHKFNNIINQIDTEYTLLLCDDDLLDPRFLEVVEPLMKDHDIVSTPIEIFGDVTEKDRVHSPEHFPFITSLIKTELVKKMGGFDVDIGALTDVEFWWRALKHHNARWYKHHEPLFKYRKHGDQDSNTIDWEGSHKRIREKHSDYDW